MVPLPTVPQAREALEAAQLPTARNPNDGADWDWTEERYQEVQHYDPGKRHAETIPRISKTSAESDQ